MKYLIKHLVYSTLALAVVAGVFFVNVSDNNTVANLALAYTVDEGSGNDGCCNVPDSPTPPDDPKNPPVCSISASLSVAKDGDAFTVTWKGSPVSANFWINGYKLSNPNDSATYTYNGKYDYMRFTMYGENSDGNCGDEVIIYKTVTGCTDKTAENYNSKANEDDGSCVYIPTLTCQDVAFTASNYTVTPGATVNLAWVFTGNVESASLLPNVANPMTVDNVDVVVNNDSTYTMKIANSKGNVSCPLTIKVQEVKQPISCAGNFTVTASPSSLPYGGGSSVLTWTANEATSVTLGGNALPTSGSKTVNLTNDSTYTFVVVGNSNTTGNSVNCPVSINVGDPVPEPISCADNVNFSVSPKNLGVGGGNVTLTWSTTDVNKVLINGTNEALSGSKIVNVTDDKIFNLVATGDSSTTGNNVSCPVAVNVEEDTEDPLTCSDVTFKASDTSVRRGSDVKLSWSWGSEVTKASISNGIGVVSNNGDKTVTINGDITYFITIENAKSNISCPLSINSESGGGGSSNPRCTLKISDEKITLGEEITLTWDTSRATEVVIKDSHGKTIMTTKDKDSKDKSDYYDGKIELKPTKDTKYTLVASRGGRERTCQVEVEVNNNITVLETRKQDPRVAGISLTTVPYTGFEAGPALTMLFYTLLTLWALFVAYVLVIKRDRLGGVSLAGAHEHNKYKDMSVAEAASARMSEAAAYVASATATTVPHNLPTETEDEPAIGYATVAEDEIVTEVDEDFTSLENHAHLNKALISSDAMRYFISLNGTGEAAAAELEALIVKGKAEFPNEDGWLVLNLERIEAIMNEETTIDSDSEQTVPANLPTVAVDQMIETVTANGMGSLAEAMVTGNVIAAYQMISHRPMVALADAAADLDALYRMRKGESAAVSDLLLAEAERLTDEQLSTAISALTGAIDGTYTTEEEAVKMAIMKAVRALS